MEGITNNLAIAIDNFINNKGVKYSFISDKMNISPQLLRKMLIKKNFNIEDANKILNCLGYKVDFTFVPIDKQ